MTLFKLIYSIMKGISMKSNLDVWAIQSDPSELDTALNNIKKDGDLILYSELFCKFRLGNYEIQNRTFDTMLVSEENDLLVMLARGGAVSSKDVSEYLDKKGFDYSEVKFAPAVDDYEDDESMTEMWFARDMSVVRDALVDVKEKGKRRVAEYYPLLPGSLELGYLTNDEGFQVEVDGRYFCGVVELEDRLILLIDSKTAPRIAEVVATLEKEGFRFFVSDNSMFKIPQIDAAFEHELKKLTMSKLKNGQAGN